ncbi:MAG: HAD-IIA family hydrolase [Caldilineales bacterium]|nr:HAD-IIA family hydrolase [Caldilineales bacterium]
MSPSPRLALPYHAWLIDMDGVIYRGRQALPAAAAFIHALQAGDHPFLFLTNNATKTPAQNAQHLAQIGIHVPPASIFTAALAAAAYLQQQLPPPARVLIIGGKGIQQALPAAGYEVVTQADAAEIVVSGLDQQVCYAQLAEAALAIRRGCPWIATNPDPTLPSERGELPGAGALLAFLAAASGRTPLIIGKPEPPIFAMALARLGADAPQTVIVGDRLETDIRGGQNAGLHTICVLTGVSSAADAAAFTPPPDHILPDLRALLT